MTKKLSPCPDSPARGTVVQFTEHALDAMSEPDRKRYGNRTGTVTGYRAGASQPIVTFEKVGRRPEKKLFEISPRVLEVVTSTPPASLP